MSQEIAVYADGVRKNDLLGDVVFWDLMPTFAMNKTQIFVGSQPLFGLNSLGGTINYSTKSGFTNPDVGIHVSYGSFNRLKAIVEYGGHKGDFGYYIGTNFWQEEGWREYSESQLSNTFGKLSYRKDKNQLNLNFQYGQTNLLGNGAFPIELLKRKEWRNQVYTHPDRSENRLFEINTNWNHQFTSRLKGQLIQTGDQLALIPNHLLKGNISYRLHSSFGITWKQMYNSKQFVRGDETNQLDPISGYWRHDISLTYYFKKQCQIRAKVRNLANAQYQTFGLLGEADEAGELLEEDLENNIFAGPASPRYFELGLSLKFGK